MLQRDTVAIPFATGVSPSIRARLLPADGLLVAENCQQVVEKGGPQKRNGHVSKQVVTSGQFVALNGTVLPAAAPVRDTFSLANPQLPASWLYGWGILDTTAVADINPYAVSPQPAVGQLLGVATRDSEIVTWDGHRMFSYATNQKQTFGETQNGSSSSTSRKPCTMPVLRARQIAKTAASQNRPDAADNGVVRACAWLASTTTVGYSAYDSDSMATLVAGTTLTFQTPVYLRLISCGAWFHILVADTAANSLEVRSFHQDSPTTLITRTLGTVDNQFDVKKIDETSFVVVKSKGGVITAFVLRQDGSIISTLTPDLSGHAATTSAAVACEINSLKQIGIIWQVVGAPTNAYFRVYNLAGGPITAAILVATVFSNARMTLSPRYLPLNGQTQAWDVYIEDSVVSGVVLHVVRQYFVGDSTSTLQSTRQNSYLASHAFRVGNRTFVWMAPSLNQGAAALQYSWFLCDSGLLPIGKLDYGQAQVDRALTQFTLPGVNWAVTDTAHPFKDRVVFSGALPFNQRVLTQANTVTPGSASPTGVFAETSIRFYQLDFMPHLRAVEAGRSAYFAGAQVWVYDGSEVVEAGFHMAPEGVAINQTAGGGSLSAGTYRYRVDLCHKNAQGEEVRSWSLVTSGVTVSANDRITVTIPTVPFTRREDSYFLIFRTQANGTVYTLANSRDPSTANFVANDMTQGRMTYIDGLSDTLIGANEYHPANSAGNYVDPLPAPACEVIAGGRDRVWLAGGELSFGEISPSRLFFPGQTPAWNPSLNIQVDRNFEPITAIGFVGDLTAIFRTSKTYILDSDGPDNSYQGVWPSPRLAQSDVGAISQESLVLSVGGLWFQSQSGLRQLSAGGGVSNTAGHEMDPLAISLTVAAAVTVPQYNQVRWYSRDNQSALVYNYDANSWTTWTGLNSVGAVYWPNTKLVVVARGDGYLWVETSGQWTDAGFPIEMRIQTSWLHAKSLGDFQRARRFSLHGQAPGALTLRTRLFYDERELHDEEFQDVFPGASASDVSNSSFWGDTFWGSGTWGDSTSDTNPLTFRDGLFRLRHRPSRQKCSVFSIEFSDLGANSAGFIPVVLGLELGVKPGLDRIPTN